MDTPAARFIVSDGTLTLQLEVAEEGGYLVTSPFVPGLVTEGETLEEVFEMAYDAKALLDEYQAETEAAAKPRRTRKNSARPKKAPRRTSAAAG